MQYTFKGFSITHDSRRIVTVTKRVSSSEFAHALDEAHAILARFPASLRNVWGCDGIGYEIQRTRGEVAVHLSTVGPRQFQKGWQALTGTTAA